MKLINNKQLKIVPLGGSGEVTKNMYVYEYGNDQIVVDCGIGFPDESAPGVDFSIPDINYLEKSKKKLHGIVVTHGHMDHYGGLPYILPRLPKNLPVYGSTLTMALAKERIGEFGLTNPTKAVEDKLKLGPFNIKLIHMTHSTPNCKHLLIKTPAGTVYHGADFKFDLNPVDGKPADFASITKAGTEGIDLLMTDCLGVEKPGLTPSERTLMGSIEEEFRKTKGKLIFTTISSSISRMEMAIRAAVKFNRKVALVGFSINKNIEAATKTGHFNVPKGVMIDARKVKNFKPNQVAIIIAGSQGQEGSALHKLATDNHRHLKLTKGDRVVVSASLIPGSESSFGKLLDILYKQDVDVAYPGIGNNLHISGHGYAADLSLMLRLTNPSHVMPIGGDLKHMHLYKKMAIGLGMSPGKVHLPDEGKYLVMENGKVSISKETLVNRDIYVDGLGIGDVGQTVLEERQTMSKHGILMVVIPVDRNNHQLKGKVQIVTRGFVYLKQSADLIKALEQESHKALKNANLKNHEEMISRVRTHLEKVIFKTTERNPLILPVVLER